MPTKEWRIDLTGRFENDGRKVTAFCNEMPIVGIGRTRGEATDNLRANADAMFFAAKSDGNIEELMRRCGGERISPQPPEVSMHRQSLGPVYLSDILEDENSPYAVLA